MPKTSLSSIPWVIAGISVLALLATLIVATNRYRDETDKVRRLELEVDSLRAMQAINADPAKTALEYVVTGYEQVSVPPSSAAEDRIDYCNRRKLAHLDELRAIRDDSAPKTGLVDTYESLLTQAGHTHVVPSYLFASRVLGLLRATYYGCINTGNYTQPVLAALDEMTVTRPKQ